MWSLCPSEGSCVKSFVCRRSLVLRVGHRAVGWWFHESMWPPWRKYVIGCAFERKVDLLSGPTPCFSVSWLPWNEPFCCTTPCSSASPQPHEAKPSRTETYEIRGPALLSYSSQGKLTQKIGTRSRIVAETRQWLCGSGDFQTDSWGEFGKAWENWIEKI